MDPDVPLPETFIVLIEKPTLDNKMFKKLGILVNPIAGIGGRAALKGSDGHDIIKQALRLQAVPAAPTRAISTLTHIASRRLDFNLKIIAAPGIMGHHEVIDAGLCSEVTGVAASGATSAEDTINAASKIAALGVDLMLFAGGDGTARDIHSAVYDKIPVLGIPAGVKMHSAVYATNPQTAADVAIKFLSNQITDIHPREVMDIDEEAFRIGTLSAKLYGYLQVPSESHLVQNAKDGRGYGEEAAQRDISEGFTESVKKGIAYVLGPGTTVQAIAEKLGIEKTLLGVDIFLDGKIIARDASDMEILAATTDLQSKIVVTPIGGQGYIFGRGNQQISPTVIKRIGQSNVMVVATPAKLIGLKGSPLLVDTGDPTIDRSLCGFIKVITGYRTETVCRVST